MMVRARIRVPEADINATEQDIRVEIFNSLLNTPHRNVQDIVDKHTLYSEKDPLFYAGLSTWYHLTGAEVRDIAEVFVANLAISTVPGARDASAYYISQLPPYQVANVIRILLGGTIKAYDKTAGKHVEVNIGMHRKSVPTTIKRTVAEYLKVREEDPDKFDNAVLRAREDLRYLYRILHIKPGKRADNILFKRRPPKDSKLAVVQRIGQAKSGHGEAISDHEIAKLIVKHKIPHNVATTFLPQTPAGLIALIDSMSPQEVINSMVMLEKNGAYDNAEVKKLVKEKISKAGKSDRTVTMKAKKAASKVADAEISAEAEKVTDEKIKNRGTIKASTLIHIDSSGSMNEAIEIGKQLSALVASICQDRKKLHVYSVDTAPIPVVCDSDKLSDWTRAFAHIRAGGMTSLGASLAYATRNKDIIEQIVIITDECENSRPYFKDAYKEYVDKMGIRPRVVILKMHGANHLERACDLAGIDYEVMVWTGDYTSLPNIIPMLTAKSQFELVTDIYQLRLPARDGFTKEQRAHNKRVLTS